MMKLARRSNMSLSRLQSPITSRWLHENYEMKDGASLPRNCLYTHYLDFCTKTGIEPVNAASFGKIIRTTFPELKTRRLGTRGQSKYHYYGIDVRHSSLYYESTHNSLYRQTSTSFQDTLMKEETGKKEFKVPQKSSPTMPMKQTTPHSTQQQETIGTILPDFPKYEPVESFDESTNDKVKTFLMMYKAHCQRILDTVIRANFQEIQNFLEHFWRGMPPHIAVILSNDDVIDIITSCDNVLYKAVGNVLIPGVLQPLPVSLTHAIQQFAKSLCQWLDRALSRLPEKLQKKKMLVARQFSQLLHRQTSLSHLAHATRTVLHHSESATQMALDLKELNFKQIIKEIAWIAIDETVSESILVKFFKQFCKLLEEQAGVEQFAEWISTLIMQCIVKPTERDVGTFQSLAQTFLLYWNFITSKIIQELTLKSAQSFGSFHLVQMLLDEYIFYLIESHADISEEIIDPVSTNEASSSNTTDSYTVTTDPYPVTSSSPASSSGRGSLSPNITEDEEVFNFPATHNNNYATDNNIPTGNQYNTFHYDDYLLSTPSNGISGSNPFVSHIGKPVDYIKNPQQNHGEYREDADIIQQLQEKTKSLMEMRTSNNYELPSSYNWDTGFPYSKRYTPYSSILPNNSYSCM